MQTKKWKKKQKVREIEFFLIYELIQRMMEHTKQLGTLFVQKKDQKHRKKRQKMTRVIIFVTVF